MLYTSLISQKRSRFSRFFALIIIVSVLVPNLYIGGIQTAQAEDVSASVSKSSTDSSPDSSSSSEASSESSKSDKTESKSDADSGDSNNDSISSKETESTSVSSTNKSSGKSSKRPVKNTPSVANDQKGNNGEENGLRGTTTPTTGSITVCTIFVNQNNVISHNADNLPNADFSIRILPRVSPPFMVWDLAFQSQNFAPTHALVSNTNDAQCFTRSELPLREEGYLYYQEVIDPANEWAVPRYNDQHVIMVDDLNDFFAYSGELFDNDPANDDFRDLNADGHIGLTAERPDRTLVILNRFTETIQNQPPQIHITGPNPTNLTVGQVFTDQGATATDPEDGDSLIVHSSGTVDTNTVGTYIITYTVTDTGGLIDTDTRIVNVLPETIVDRGSLTVCKMIINATEGVIVKDGSGVPAGHFEIDIAERIDIENSVIRTAVFDVSTFIPNEKLIPTSPSNDAQCITFNDLPIDDSNLLPAYFYAQERITGDVNGEWGAPGYNDQFTIPVDDADDFFAYTSQLFDADPSNDNLRNVNSDGHIGLTLEQPNRTLVILNTYTPDNGGPVNTPPEITVLGANPTTITVGDSYVDAGATATDAEEGDITNRIITTGSVNTNTVGTYTITYFVEDAGGLTDTDTRTVHVIPQGGGEDFGSVTVCKMIADTNGNIATSTTGLPAGRFDIVIGETLDISSTAVATTTFNTQSFTPNRAIFGTENNAECVTINNLLLDNTVTPPGLPSYFYSQEMITDAETSTWGTPRYSDQFVNTVDELSDLYAYTPQFFDADPSNDGLRNVESDGHIGLTSVRPDRTLIVLNTYTAENNPPTNTPPVITVIGNNPFTITVGNTYTDQGATANDAQDGDITNRIVTIGTSTVDVNTIGTYTVTYFVEDNGGLTDTKTRTVNVVAEDDDNGGGGGGGGGGRRNPGRVLGEEVEPAACFYLRDHMRRDWNNDPVEVLKLQYFLKNLEGFTTLETTGVFDQATFDAVSAFQIRYFGDILAPWGHTTSTGFVYILTKKKVNEIFCQKAFPVTSLEQEEIDNFRAFLTGLRAQGIDINVDDSMMTDDSKSPTDKSITTDNMEKPVDVMDAMKSEDGKSLKDKISDLIGFDFMKSGGFGSANLKAVAGAIFSLPHDRAQVLESLYFLLIAIIAVYLLTEIAVGSMNTENMSKYQIWKRKAIGYTLGLIVAIIFAVWYEVFGIVAALLVLLAASIIFWIYSAVKAKKVTN